MVANEAFGAAGKLAHALGSGLGLRLFHYGVVVDDLESAKSMWGSVLGCAWASTATYDIELTVEGVRQPVIIDAAYSTLGPVHIELIQERRGDVWSRYGLDHVGFYADDIGTAIGELERRGMPQLFALEGADGSEPRCSYHGTGSGLWVELVQSGFADKLAEWIGTY